MKHSVLPAAREDILRQFRYYLIERDSESSAQHFLTAVRQAIEQVCSHPQIGSPKMIENPVLQGLRAWPLKGFASTRIYYLCQEERLRIVRVLHAKRDIDSILEDEGIA